jgi:cytochrome c oxidase assembly protein subunit 15
MVAVPSLSDQTVAQSDAESLVGVRRWLLFLILLVFAMVLVGGATRLTESGLSITEWNLVTGAVPPLNADAWDAEFRRYKESPQYDLLNRGMSLESFKTIYWWEWAHRELGRFIGLVYIAGFFWFVGRRGVPLRTALVLAGMGLLLGAQGVVGWIMVASGLEPGMTAVAPVRLALHLTLAALFFAALVAVYVRLGGARSEAATAGEKFAARTLVALAFIQIALGGLVAGHDAGLTYNTWPLMDGRFIPKGLGMLQPWWLNVFDNITAIQFNHRIAAYVLAAAILAYAVAMRRADPLARNRALLLSALVLAQIVVGVLTLVAVVPLNLALIHQATALILLVVLVWNATALGRASA